MNLRHLFEQNSFSDKITTGLYRLIVDRLKSVGNTSATIKVEVVSSLIKAQFDIPSGVKLGILISRDYNQTGEASKIVAFWKAQLIIDSVVNNEIVDNTILNLSVRKIKLSAGSLIVLVPKE